MKKQQFKQFLIAILVISVSTVSLQAQDNRMQFTHLKVEDGLTENYLSCVVKDAQGFMWFGANSQGLNKFDGYQFTTYKNEPENPNSISSDGIRCLFVDSKGTLWIGTTIGLNLYDADRDHFTRLKTENDSTLFATEPVLSIYEDKEGTIWIGTDSDVYRFRPETADVRCYTNDPEHETAISGFEINGFVEEEDGQLWITSTGGLTLLNKETGQFKDYSYNPDDETSISSNNLYDICADKNGDLWITTFDNGFNRFDKKTQSFERFTYDPNDWNSIRVNRTRQIISDGKGNLYISTENGGLNIFNVDSREFEVYLPDIDDNKSISSNSIYEVYIDDQEILWAATYNGGVSYASKQGQGFRHIEAHGGGLNNPHILGIMEDRWGDLWIATDGGGLNHSFGRTGRFEYFKHNPLDENSISTNAIMTVFEDRQGTIWAGGWDGGLMRYNALTRSFKIFKHRPSDATTLADNNVYTIFEDSRQQMYVASMSTTHLFNKRTGKFTPLENIYPGVSSPTRSMFEDRFGNLWIVSNNSDDIHFIIRNQIPNGGYPIDLKTVIAGIDFSATVVTGDSKNNLWFGDANAGGLTFLNTTTGETVRYSMADGMSSNRIQDMHLDGMGGLWMSTDNGICRFLDAVNVPENPVFLNYDMADGLQGTIFKRGASFKTRSGEIFFGGDNGFNSFFPENIMQNPHTPPIVFTGFSIFRKQIRPGVTDSPLKESLNKTEQVKLSYKQNMLEFEFAALNFILPEKNQYAYMLEEFEKEWNFTTERTASYTNLKPGNYTFRVKGSNNDGVWNEEGREILIRIKPPFWATWPFRIIMLAALIFGVAFFYRYRMRALQEQREQLEKIVNERTGELEQKSTEITTSNEKMAATGRMLATNSFEMSQTTSKINSAMIAVSEGAATQDEQLKRTQDVITQLLESISHTSYEAKLSARSASKTVDTVVSGSETMEQSMNNMENIKETVGATWKSVEVISKRIGRIDEILSLINDIASRVNVLALNASIEATKAGEFGSGFMVVAQEIRKLSKSTSDSTEEIAAFITEFQSDINSIEKDIKKGIDQVQQSAQWTKDSRKAMSKIRNSVESEKERLLRMAERTADMQKLSREVVIAAEAVSKVSTRNRQTVEDVNQNTHEMNEKMEELTRLANMLGMINATS